MYRFRFLLLALLVALAGPATTSHGQKLPEISSAVDSLFADWSQPGHPGGSVAIMQEGEIIYSRAFGLASLEYQIPNTPGTLFNVASVSKQFTAYGILLLDEAGHISIDDDIRTYLPEMPDFGHTITIRHLLHHTSGLRSLHALLEMAGWGEDDRKRTEDLMRLMERQRDLNFIPGEEYLYCNTGYIFMAQIIERVTDEAFTDWMKANVFQPLGMAETYVEDDIDRIVPNNAMSYYGPDEDGRFRYAIPYWDYEGSGNVHTTTGDLLRWLTHLSNPRRDLSATNRMFNRGILNNGDTLDYANGIRVDAYQGERRIGHSGSIGGYRARVYSFPKQELHIVVLANFSTSNPSAKARSISDLFLGEPKSEGPLNILAFDAPKPVKVDTVVFDAYAGRYVVNEAPGAVVRVYREGQTFYAQSTGQGRDRLVPASDSSFYNVEEMIVITFRKDDQGGVEFKAMVGTSEYSGYRLTPPDPETLETFTGTYFSPELSVHYFLRVEGDQLVASHPRLGDVPLLSLEGNEFDAAWPLGRVVFEEGGMKVSNGRARNVWFEKISSQ